MTLRSCFQGSLATVALAVVLGVASQTERAWADAPVAAAVKKAGKHFQRGVALYNEADYRAALVEFRRAYEVAPNAAVLYNIGQTYYQLQSYAQALTTLERYLAEAGAAAPHADEVEQTVELLRSRVGNVEISTNLDGCEVTVDDELAGKTPINEPVLVSIGRRKVIAMCEGHAAETRIVDVAAGDVVKVPISIANATPAQSLNARPDSAPTEFRDTTATWRKVTWGAAGVLAAGSVTVGILAVLASRDLNSERDSYPASPQALSDKASKAKNLSLAADVLGAAAIIAGGAALTLTLTRPRARQEVRVSLAPRGLQLSGTFE